MKMLKEIRLEGFKAFAEMEIELSNITVLTGVNSSGKSSVIQALRMWLEYKNKIPLNNKVNNLKSSYLEGYGGYSEIKSKYSYSGKSVIISVADDEGREETINISPDNLWGYSQDSSENDDSEINTRNIEYIGANRHGPMPYLPVKSYGDEITVGEKGEYSVDYFLNFESALVNERLLHPSTSSLVFRHQLNSWMEEIAPGTELEFTKHDKHDISHIEVNGFRAANTGFGISYSLPIVLASLALTLPQDVSKDVSPLAQFWISKNCRTAPVLFVENPEAHLHPKGQTAMGRLLSMVADCGVQVIVETHSDHFLDGVRMQVRKGHISQKKVGIYFFEKTKQGESYGTRIEIDSKGKLDKWPKGFFDQSIDNLRELTT